MNLASQSRQRGQALLEAAITIPLLLLLVLGFYEVSLVVQSDLDLTTAVGLAAAAAATAPAGDGTVADEYAQATFQNTVKHFSLLQSPALVCAGPYQAGDTVHCTASAVLALSDTPFAEISPSITLSESAAAVISAYRASG